MTFEMSLEKTYCKNSGIDHRKRFAQFFTPESIADLMVRWILGGSDCKTVLEPAFGLGVFSRALLKYESEIKISGFELDPKIFSVASKEFNGCESLNLHLEDYISSDWHSKYDGIVCNPPYFKYHNYDSHSAIENVYDYLNFRPNGATNLYALFLLKSLSQLKSGGRMAYIIPSEFLNSDYGVLIKSYILKSRSLRHIFVINFKENVFDDALTTAAILFFAKDDKSNNIHFSSINDVEELDAIEDFIGNYPSIESDFCYKYEDLDPTEKWRKYYQARNSDKYNNLVPFSMFAKVMRGIATGANDYFMFNESKAKKFAIPKDNLVPCISKSKDIKPSVFTKYHYKELVDSDELVYLFNGSSCNKFAISYILKGEAEGIDKKYLTRNRTPWFAIENRPPAPIWVSVFNRDRLKFVKNEANVYNLTTFHCVYPKNENLFSPLDLDILFAYLMTPTANDIFNDNRREYGNGLKKFEPNDLNNAKALDLTLLSRSENNKIIELFNLFRKDEERSFIYAIDSIFKEKFEI